MGPDPDTSSNISVVACPCNHTGRMAPSETSDELAGLQDQIRAVETQILKVESDITTTEVQIEETARKVAELGGPGAAIPEVQYWVTEKQQLRTKKQQLRTKKQQLRTEKEQLRTKELLREKARGLGKRKREGYLDKEFPSASDFSRDTAAAMVAQGQVMDGEDLIFADVDPLAANGRCLRRRCPVALVHRAFGLGVQGLHTRAAELQENDWAFYYDCVKVLVFYYQTEASLQERFTSVLDNYLRAASIPAVTKPHHTYGVITGPMDTWVSLLEFKCMQGDAELQLARYYLEYVKSHFTTNGATLAMQSTSLPCITLEVVGNELRDDRLGALWYETVVCSARIGCVELREDSSIEERRAGAALIRSWRVMVEELHSFYGSQPHLCRGLDAREGVPYALTMRRRFEDFHTVVRWRVYTARAVQTDTAVVIKFVEHYRQDAHQLWGDRGFAARLLEIEELPGGYFTVVMERLTPEEGWKTVGDLPVPEQVALKPQLLDLLRRAHEATDEAGRHFVHGDARPSNIMVRHREDQGDSDLRLIDLDWSGVDGVDRYLIKPNPYLAVGKPRPMAIVLGALMRTQHDIDTMNASLGYHFG